MFLLNSHYRQGRDEILELYFEYFLQAWIQATTATVVDEKVDYPKLLVIAEALQAYHNEDDNNEPAWPSWAVGALLRGVRCIHINRELKVFT
jgi:hypothetical protein